MQDILRLYQTERGEYLTFAQNANTGKINADHSVYYINGIREAYLQIEMLKGAGTLKLSKWNITVGLHS